MLLTLLGLAGCGTIANHAGFPLFTRTGQLADPQAIATCLPPLIYLDTQVSVSDGSWHFRVEDRLAELGAKTRGERTIVDSGGKVIYVKPESFPSNAADRVMEEDKRFVTAILTKAELAKSADHEITFKSDMKSGD